MILNSKAFLCYASLCIAAANFNDLLNGQLVPWGSLAVNVPVLCNRVSLVGPVRSKKEMGRIHASPVVAMMKNKGAMRNCPERKLISYTMRRHVSMDHAVSPRKCSEAPITASCGSRPVYTPVVVWWSTVSKKALPQRDEAFFPRHPIGVTPSDAARPRAKAPDPSVSLLGEAFTTLWATSGLSCRFASHRNSLGSCARGRTLARRGPTVFHCIPTRKDGES